MRLAAVRLLSLDPLEGGVDHKGGDAAATTARTVENVLGEHPAQPVGDTVAP